MCSSKKWLLGLLGFVMCLGLAAADKQDVKAWEEYPEGSYIVCTSDTQLHVLPDCNSEVLGDIHQGNVASVLATGEEYYKVNLNNLMGYMHRDQIGYNEEIVAAYKAEQQKLMNEDVRMIAAMIQCESGAEVYEGKIAVGVTIMNRVKSGSYPNTVAEVIYQPNQYGPSDSNKFAELLANDTIKESCRQAALEAYKGLDNIGGAVHFRRAGSREGIVIGNHVFY